MSPCKAHQVWFFIPILRNSDFKQLAIYKKLNPNRLENYLIEFKFCEDNRPNTQYQIAKAQNSVTFIDRL